MIQVRMGVGGALEIVIRDSSGGLEMFPVGLGVVPWVSQTKNSPSCMPKIHICYAFYTCHLHSAVYYPHVSVPTPTTHVRGLCSYPLPKAILCPVASDLNKSYMYLPPHAWLSPPLQTHLR